MALARRLRGVHYDQAIVLPRSFKSALIPALARIPKRTGYRGEMRFGLINDMRPLDKTVLTQTVQRFVALGLPSDAALPPSVPLPQLQIDQANQQRVINQLGLNLVRPVAGLMPGAEYGPAKQWPAARFKELAAQLTEQGYQVWLFGSAKEQALCDSIAVNEHTHNLAGRTRLEDAVDLIAASKVTITNDSGLMHIACATGVAVVAIYGSSSPNYTPPLSMRATVLYKGLDCSPCFDRHCRFGHTHCLTQIRLDDVQRAIANSV
jgi:heptosyltransferase-2